MQEKRFCINKLSYEHTKILFHLTSEFNEVYFSEMGEAEANHGERPPKFNLGGETCKVS
jgi:hypothetical protein